MSIVLITGPWKRKCLVDLGIVTQCIAPIKIDHQYVTNMLMKINAKVLFMNKINMILLFFFFLNILKNSIHILFFIFILIQMGGINSLLSMEFANAIPLVSRTPTIIFGMDVSHGSPGRADVPSIAAVCNN